MDNWLALPLDNLTSIFQVIVGIIIYILSWILFRSAELWFQGIISKKNLESRTKSKITGTEKIQEIWIRSYIGCFARIYWIPEKQSTGRSKIALLTLITWICLKFWILKTCGSCFIASYERNLIILIIILLFVLLVMYFLYRFRKKVKR